MTPAEKLLVLALLAQVVLTFLVLIQLGAKRRKAVTEKRLSGNPMVDASAWPEDARKVQSNFANQFETPVLFYALGLLALQVKAAGLVFAVLAWLYVLTRIAHNRIHTGPNTIAPRFGTFFAGVVVLMVMTVLVAIHVLSGGF